MLQKKKEPQPKRESRFTRGYAGVTERVNKSSKFLMSCFNCEHYYQAVGDSNEVCQNNSVLQYDVVVTDNGIYCNQWQLCSRKETAKGLFKKGVRR